MIQELGPHKVESHTEKVDGPEARSWGRTSGEPILRGVKPVAVGSRAECSQLWPLSWDMGDLKGVSVGEPVRIPSSGKRGVQLI